MKIGMPCLMLKGGTGAAKGKHAGNARAVACEGLEERWGKDADIIRELSELNTYEAQPGWEGLGFTSGRKLSEWWQEQADAHRVEVKGKDGQTHYRKLRGDAGIGFSVIAKPEAEWINGLEEDEQERFLADLQNVVVDVLAEHGLQTQVVATHRDEQGAHPHFFGYDPEYRMAKKIGLKLFADFNKEVPERMRALGWAEVEDVQAYDPEKVEAKIAEATQGMGEEEAEQYRQDYKDELVKEKKARKKSGRSSKKYKADRDEERARQAQEDADVAIAMRDSAQYELARIEHDVRQIAEEAQQAADEHWDFVRDGVQQVLADAQADEQKAHERKKKAEDDAAAAEARRDAADAQAQQIIVQAQQIIVQAQDVLEQARKDAREEVEEAIKEERAELLRRQRSCDDLRHEAELAQQAAEAEKQRWKDAARPSATKIVKATLDWLAGAMERLAPALFAPFISFLAQQAEGQTVSEYVTDHVLGELHPEKTKRDEMAAALAPEPQTQPSDAERYLERMLGD